MKVDPSIGVAVTTMQHQTRGGELSEDVLEMALRLAQEMPEEGSIELEALKERMANRPGNHIFLFYFVIFCLFFRQTSEEELQDL